MRYGKRGLSELRKGRSPLKAEILMTLDPDMDRNCCKRMAAACAGHVTEVRRFDHLPERLLALLRTLQQ